MIEQKYTHIKLDYNQESKICYLIIDKQSSNVNTLDIELLKELKAGISYLSKELQPKVLIIKSGKKSGFIAGADLKQFTNIKTDAEATELISFGQTTFAELHALPCITIALVDGFCVGGGYELALACNYIIAVDNPKSKFGLPEIMLGIHPGWGGTIRLLKRIGSLKGLELIITGKLVNSYTAKKLNMIDAVVKEYHIENCINYFLNKKPALIKAPRYEQIVLLDFIRPLIGKFLIKKLAKKINRLHYPAPFAVLDNWVEYGLNTEAAYTQEAASMGKLFMTPTAHNLVKVFLLRDRLKALGKEAQFMGKKIHVKGAGVMGGDIAAWCALHGYIVSLEDLNLQAIANSFKRARELFTKKLVLPHLIQAACDRLQADPKGLQVAKADLIIEAVVEDLAVKRACFIELEAKAKLDAILATNTSTFPLTELGVGMQNPARVVGLHFFNPVAKMPLVEVVAASNTAPDLVKQCLAFVTTLDQLPLPVTSSPGFLVNRILVPYLLESIALFEEGIPPEVIDKAAVDFGMPLGPIELADTVGLDICQAAALSLGKEVPNTVNNFIKQGKLGKKTSAGFYTYVQGKKRQSKNTDLTIPKAVKERLIKSLLEEAKECLAAKVVTDADLLDAGMVFGAGFAPFRGGPMQYLADLQSNISE